MGLALPGSGLEHVELAGIGELLLPAAPSALPIPSTHSRKLAVWRFSSLLGTELFSELCCHGNKTAVSEQGWGPVENSVARYVTEEPFQVFFSQ